jgi:hypothetical protein
MDCLRKNRRFGLKIIYNYCDSGIIRYRKAHCIQVLWAYLFQAWLPIGPETGMPANFGYKIDIDSEVALWSWLTRTKPL